MAEVRFDALAAATLERLYDDSTKTQLADRVDEWLDRLEAGDEATTRTSTTVQHSGWST